MEDGVKGDPAQPKAVRFLSKAGWVKKATGRLLAGYKDRFIHVEKTEVVVYENEDLKTCLERFDLENYEKCQELKSVFKKKNRLILIRAPKCANKIHDVKFQVQTPEDKEAWIKALSEGINRAKNKIFDEVKVESINLDHVTRTRPKGNRGRRPPTRIHMKEVANISSEGILRLDLDVPDTVLFNDNHYENVDIKDPPKDTLTPPMPPSSTSNAIEKKQSSSPEEDEPQTVVEPTPPKKIFKPPMPPSKDNKSVSAIEWNGPSIQDDPEKVSGSPTLPSKELKPSVLPAEEDVKDLSEGVPGAGAGEKTDPPMTPPAKPSSTENLAEALSPVQETRPPTIPPKDKKPRKDSDELEGTSTEIIEKVSEMDPSLSLLTVKQPEVEDISESHGTGEHPKISEATPEPISDSPPSGPANNVPSSNKHQGKELPETTATLPSPDSPSLESTRKNPSPLPPLKKKPLKMCPPVKQPQPEDQPTGNTDTAVTQHEDSSSSATQLETASVPSPDSPSLESTRMKPSPLPPVKKKPLKMLPPVKQPQPEDQPTGNTDTAVIQHEDSSSSATQLETASVPSVCTPYIEETPGPTIESHNDIPKVVLTLSEPEQTEEISEGSICQIEGDSMDSGSEDPLVSSTFALKGSQVGLDSLYASEDDGEDYNREQISDVAPPGTGISQITSSVQINLIQAQLSKQAPPIPLKPIAKTMSSSVGDLLRGRGGGETEKRQRSRDISQRDSDDGLKKVKNLEREIALGLEQTKELLSCTSQTQREGHGKNMPEDLLAKAMEKLRMADHFLREAQNIDESNRQMGRKNRSSF